MVNSLPAFSSAELTIANDLLSITVSAMLGRKMEEGDWNFVYSNSKRIPISAWSNLNIDICHNGLGVEHKMLRVVSDKTILEECGTTKMHPAGTRSIRIPDEEDADSAMKNILGQYTDIIEERTKKVKENSENDRADMRFGWLLWKETLDEFLYFEEKMEKPNPKNYFARWHETLAAGSRKSSRSLWIFDKSSKRKKYSVTTTAGAKIQPYFDIPSPEDPNLYYFKVQGVHMDGGLVRVWLTKSTAAYLELLVGELSCDALSSAILNAEYHNESCNKDFVLANDRGTSVIITSEAYSRLRSNFKPISDEYLFQQLAMQLGSN